MDLLAYAQIEEYENLLTSNHIEIPRLRGIDPCEGMKPWTDCIREYYLVTDKSSRRIEVKGIRWDRIHGWKRRRLKTEIHNNIKKFERCVDTWNKYCGCKDILRIHSRIGGKNWSYYGGEKLVGQPWFIEKVDDYFDSTYCDIYVRINQ